MSITIKTEKVIIRGEQKRKIISIDMLKDHDLPEEYTKAGEFMCSWNNMRQIGYKGVDETKTDHTASSAYLTIGEILLDSTLQECLKNIRRCGNRLQKINKRLAKENADWAGEETFVI